MVTANGQDTRMDASYGLTVGAGKHETGDPDASTQNELQHKKARKYLSRHGHVGWCWRACYPGAFGTWK